MVVYNNLFLCCIITKLLNILFNANNENENKVAPIKKFLLLTLVRKLHFDKKFYIKNLFLHRVAQILTSKLI